MKKYGIEGCPEYEVFTEEKPAHAFIEKLGDVAVKPSGPDRRQRRKSHGRPAP